MAKRTTYKRIVEYDARNVECARIILADPDRFGGLESLMTTWARTVVGKIDPTGRKPATDFPEQ